jgi:Fe-S-cluster-containing hydrogenase component 2
MNSAAIKNFSSDPNRDVCPVGAIDWDSSNEVPSIDSAKCIGCGLCVMRCPIGAIGLVDDKAHVSTIPESEDNDFVSLVKISEQKDLHLAQISELPQIDSASPIYKDDKVEEIVKAIAKLPEAQQKIAVRSALMISGISTTLTRKGDVHARADGLISTADGLRGPIEIEFGTDSLEAIRAILDDVAVLHSKFSIDLKDQDPLIVFHVLPRVRQGYWQVVSDIQEILGVRVHTVSLGGLMLLVWNSRRLSSEDLVNLSPNSTSTSIRSLFETVLERKIMLKIGQGGVLEPEK